MIFDRSRVQLELERIIACPSPEKLGEYKVKFKNIKLTPSNKECLIPLLKNDSRGLFFKGTYSLCEAVNNIFSKRYSWAIIKLYYSSFYLIKCLLATEHYALVKCKGSYILKLDVGYSPEELKSSKSKSSSGGEHPRTIQKYIELMRHKDSLLSNKVDGIEGEDIYTYLQEMRNIVNYRDISFCEPENRYFEGVDKEKIKFYMEDPDLIYCFQSPHCLLASPLHLLKNTREKLSVFLGDENIISDKQDLVIEDLLKPHDLFEIFKKYKLI